MAKTFQISAVFKVIDQFSAPFQKMGRSIGNLLPPMKKVEKSLKKMGKGMGDVGKKMSTRLTAPIAAFGALTIKTTRDFQESMNKVSAITGAVGEDYEKLSNLAKELGASTQFSASQAADAMTFLGMAGLSTKDVMEALPGTLELAAAGGLELAQAADIATNIMTSMGKEAKDLGTINNILAKTASSANTNIEQLAEAMLPVAPIAQKLGIELPQMSAMLGKMADQGVRGGRAGTFLRNALLSVVNPSGKLISVFKKLQINVKDFVTKGGKIKNFEVLIKQLSDRGATAGDIMQAFGERGGQAIALLTAEGKSAKDIATFTKQIIGAKTAAADMADTMKKGLPGALKELSSSFEGLQLSIAESGFGKFVEGLTRDLAGLLRNMSKTNPEFISFVTVLLGVAAAIGPILIGLGQFMFFAPSMMQAIEGIGEAIMWLGVKLKKVGLFLMANPILLAIAAIALAAYLIYEYWEPISDFFIKLWDDIVEVAIQLGDDLYNALIQPFVDLWDYISPMFDRIKTAIKGLVGFLPEAMQKKLGFTTTIENKAYNPNDIKSSISNSSQAEVTVKVMSDAGTTATIDKVKKRGAGKVKVQNESIFGWSNEFVTQ